MGCSKMENKKPEVREFGCNICGDMEIVTYYVPLDTPDRHECKNCGTAYWWADDQQKLYRESTREVMPDHCMVLCKNEQ